MNVICLNSKTARGGAECGLFTQKSSPLSGSGNERFRELLIFGVGVALTLLAPSLGLGITVCEWWPLYLVAGNLALGSMLGVVLYRVSSVRFMSCVPSTSKPKALSIDLKKAA